jgi:hypothetical protein
LRIERATKPTSTANQSVAKRTRIIAAVLVPLSTFPSVIICSCSAPSVTPRPPGTGTSAPARVLVA